MRLGSDRKGMLVAGLCFIHCVAGPALLALGGLSSAIGLSEKFEPVFLLSSIVFGAAALVPAHRKRHRRRSCLVLFGCGIACLLLRGRIRLGIAMEHVETGIGAALIIGGHALNVRFSRQCPCCAPDASEKKLKIGSWE